MFAKINHTQPSHRNHSARQVIISFDRFNRMCWILSSEIFFLLNIYIQLKNKISIDCHRTCVSVAEQKNLFTVGFTQFRRRKIQSNETTKRIANVQVIIHRYQHSREMPFRCSSFESHKSFETDRHTDRHLTVSVKCQRQMIAMMHQRPSNLICFAQMHINVNLPFSVCFCIAAKQTSERTSPALSYSYSLFIHTFV